MDARQAVYTCKIEKKGVRILAHRVRKRRSEKQNNHKPCCSVLYFKEGAHSPILTTFNLTHPLSIRNGLRISISNRISTLIWTICVSRACAALKNLCDVNTGCRKKKQKNSCRRSTTVNTNFDISSLQVQVLSYMLTRRQEYYLEN